MKSPERIAAEAAYDNSLEVFRAASRAFNAVTLRYRSREIGDDEFLSARAVFMEANRVSDAAEAEFINRLNAETNQMVKP